MKIENYLTHIDNIEDKPYLKSKLLNVNIRLLKSNPEYKAIVKSCCDLLEKCALTKMEGYKLPHGTSGANLGIPFNIIAIVKNRGEKGAFCDIMINPKIIETSNKMIETYSNCGSIRLKQPIKINRHESVKVVWNDLDGNIYNKTLNRENGGLTIQHEIDHNLGILITDRV